MNPSKTASTSRVKTFSKLCALLALGVLSNACFAEDKPKAQIPAAADDGWISLFNGKDLAGWEGLEGYWTVVDLSLIHI